MTTKLKQESKINRLSELAIGKSAIIEAVGGTGALRQHFLDMGVIPGARIRAVKKAPLGDPVEYCIHGYELTLRLEDSANIEISESVDADDCDQCESCARREDASAASAAERKPKSEHPGLGEGGKFHPKGTGNPLPDDTVLTFALVGNQNSGKTTLFNQLTGANQHVGNFPGVTVDRKDGPIRGNKYTRITDLPGIYSMSPYSSEEIVSRNFVLEEKPHAIINIVDATNVERNLYLTMQLLEMEIPVVVALNMMDEVAANGGTIDVNEMEAQLGTPVVPISAAKNQGVDELIDHAIHIAKYQEKPTRMDFCDESDNGGAVHRCIHAVAHLIQDHAREAGLPWRFSATKVIEGDEAVIEALKLDQNELETVRHIVLQMEQERGLDHSAAIADMRYSFIQKVATETVHKSGVSREQERSARLDSVLTGRYTAIPVFIGIMALVFWLTFNVIGAWLQGLLENGIGALTDAADSMLTSAGVGDAIHGLIIEGVFEGVGSVLSFIPIIITLFFFLSLMEDSGYIARVAFVMDKLLRKIGLSGRSIVPLLIGFGCTVPAVMSTRTLPSERDRKMTILLTPFMSCTAKLPIYAFFVNAFFPGRGGLIMTGLYVLGIVMAILIALLYRKALFKGEAAPFVMELPNYRMPSAGNVVRLLWDKSKDFLQRAFSVILIATIVVWILQSFDFRFQFVENSHESILAGIAGLLAPIMAPVGLGDWRICTSLITGFMAKESVVSTLQILFEGSVGAAITAASAGSLLVFSLLYAPCVAAVAAIRRELGTRWMFFVIVWQCVIAWIAAFATFLIIS